MLRRGRSRCKAPLASHLRLVVIAAQGTALLPLPSPCRCPCSHLPAIKIQVNRKETPAPSSCPAFPPPPRQGIPRGSTSGRAGMPRVPRDACGSGCQPRPSRVAHCAPRRWRRRKKCEKTPYFGGWGFLMHFAGKLKETAAQKAELFSSLSGERSPPQAWAALEESLGSAAAGCQRWQ